MIYNIILNHILVIFKYFYDPVPEHFTWKRKPLSFDRDVLVFCSFRFFILLLRNTPLSYFA